MQKVKRYQFENHDLAYRGMFSAKIQDLRKMSMTSLGSYFLLPDQRFGSSNSDLLA
jgi:hypothetical protein